MHEREDVTVKDQHTSIPLIALRVEVVSGADAGKVVTTQNDALSIGTAAGNDLVLADASVSRFHLELSRAKGGVRITDHESTNGTFLGTARIERAIVALGTQLRVGRTVVSVVDGDDVRVPLLEGDVLAGLRGRSPAMRRLMAQIERAAQSNASALVVGESGTGKELAARALHELGPRRQGPFVTVDCGSLAPTLIASELFGHEKGAFTGAVRQHVGAFEQATGGTVFLDEIGELPQELQSTLLGALERRRFRRLGGRVDVEVDVRVVAATNRDLRAEVNRGRFRLDLFYRLAVITLRMPPLRERPEDVPLLVEHFARIAGVSGSIASVFSAETLLDLSSHHWTGNVRELRNVVEATLAMGETPPLGDPGTDDDSSEDERVAPERPPNTVDPLDGVVGLRYKDARAKLLHDFERRYFTALLERVDGNVARAAREAGLDRTYLTQLLQRHGMR
jgi:DNA-binding NtrC family response regulator